MILLISFILFKIQIVINLKKNHLIRKNNLKDF
jgi:hypothetical protein